MDAPPTREQWAIESEWRGHSPADVIQYLSDCADFEDAQVRRRALPANVILADSEPRAITFLRRIFGQ